ncbi:MAG TPA: HD domain-containing phosphohydrolase [Chroococcales cyanobacterium]
MSLLILRLFGLTCILSAIFYLFYLFLPKPKPPAIPVRERRTPSEWGEKADRAERYSLGHARRVSRYARMLAEAAKLDLKSVMSVEEAGLLHDIGEIDWCAELLSRQGPFDSDERLLLAEHPARGSRLAEKAGEIPWSHLWVRWHHERYDGTGYPDGLWAEDIPVEARILAIADSFDSMCHSRPYRSALDQEEALTEIQRLAGIHYDPHLVQLFAERISLDGFSAG